MPEKGPEDRDEQKEHKTPESPKVLIDSDWGREWSGVSGWIRQHPILFILVLLPLLAAGWWAYRTYRRDTPPPIPREIGPVDDSVPMLGAPDSAEPRTAIRALSDSVVSGPAGSSTVLTVRVVGAVGRPAEGRLVRFRIAQGSGTLGRDTVRTDAEGLARAPFTLSSRPGPARVVAELVGSLLPAAHFSITVLAGTPRQATIVDGNRQAGPPGSLLPQHLRVRVMDAGRSPVPDVEVRFHVVGGGGMVAPDVVRTDAEGYASALWRLGAAPGEQHVAALVPAIGDVLLTFDATARAAAEPARAPETPQSATVVPRAFAVGGNFVCTLAGGRVACRGGNDRGQRLSGSSTQFLAVVAGVSHACALTHDGEAFCWGANESGQLGDGSRTDRARPVPVDTDARFSTLAAGVAHTCGLDATGRALCWGGDSGSDEPTQTDRLTPRPVPGDRRFVQLVAGWNHTCALTANGEAYCWGSNDRGQLGDGTRIDRAVPSEVPGTFESLAAGNAHTCGIRAGAVFCWGDNRSGQLGDGTTQNRSEPVRVGGLPAPATRLAAGAVSTCALLANGRVYCWGQNVHGELGDRTRESHSTPVPVAGDLAFRSIDAGGALTCGFTADGAQYCWGLNQSGQLGDGTRESRSVPTRVGG